MAAFSFSLSTSPLPTRHFKRLSISPSLSSLPFRSTKIPNKSLTLRTASISASSYDDFSASNQNSRSKVSFDTEFAYPDMLFLFLFFLFC